MLLLLDNFDSFTYNLVDYFGQLGLACRVHRQDVPLAEVVSEPYTAVVLSPGPGTPATAGNLLEVVAHYHQRLPMLGVCLGHQALGTFFGARLDRAARPMHGKCSPLLVSSPDDLFVGLPAQFNVVRYHSLLLYDLPAELRPLAYTPEGELMALRHTHWPLTGIQFHPEAVLTQYGLDLLANWAKGAGLRG